MKLDNLMFELRLDKTKRLVSRKYQIDFKIAFSNNL
jgi:hypothetical protein